MADNKAIYKMTFKKKLEQVGVPFRLEQDKLYFMWKGVNCCLSFNADNGLQLYALHIMEFASEQLEEACLLCNELNKQINWLKFIISRRSELICMVSSAVNADDVVEDCLELLALMHKAVTLARRQLALL